MKLRWLMAAALLAPAVFGSVPADAKGAASPLVHGAGNPLLPGYFADPSVVEYRGEWFVFATVDPWGADTLGLWRSKDLRNWTFETPNWPTKQAATSPTSNNSQVWAPSVVHGRDGRFWMYVSVGSEVWVGVADHPAGPWHDANGGKPLIPGNFRPGYHMIDAEAFIDDDGQAYLYWGSGLHWVNGHCFVVKLKPDMVTFDGEPKDVTPDHYFEGPFMVKRNGRYFLTSSWGNTTKDTYQVRYAVGDTPFGPFHEPKDAPILATDHAKGIVSPGHHAIFRAGGQDFILYHRAAVPYVEGGPTLRQVAVDRITFNGGLIEPVSPTHESPAIPGAAKGRHVGLPLRLRATGVADPVHTAAMAGDDNYATLYRAAPTGGSLIADLGAVRNVAGGALRPARVLDGLGFSLSASADGKHWRQVMPQALHKGSPVALPAVKGARYLRLDLPQGGDVLEWSVYPR